MKILLSSRGLFILAFVMVVTTNIVVLMGVASNRSGEPEAQIILTERELTLQQYNIFKENSGLTLRLTWRTMSEDYYFSAFLKRAAWLNAEKLEELGFNIDDYLSPIVYKRLIPKEVFIVLENNSEACREVEMRLEKEEGLCWSDSEDKRSRMHAVKEAKERLKKNRSMKSRLFAIDAGVDPKILREKYKDRTRFIIAKGLVRPVSRYYEERKEVDGYITQLSIESIHVPLKYRKIFDTIFAQDKLKKKHREVPHSPRYEIELAYGSRFEPWIVSVKYIGDK